MTDNLPAKNADGFITLSDFYSHHREPIESALKNAQIPHQIEFYVYRNVAFRLYVPAEHLETARKLCMAIEGTVVF